MRRCLVAAAVTCLLLVTLVAAVQRAAAAGSGATVFEGTIGKAKVIMILDTPSSKLTGSYFYRTSGIDIGLNGTAAKLDEVDPNSITNYEQRVTGTFAGVLSADMSTYKGTWKSVKGSKSTPFSLKNIGSNPWGSAQSVTITNTVKTVKSKLGPASYRFPVVVGTKPDWVAIRINADVKNRSLGDEALPTVIADFQKNGSGITGVDYKINHNANGLLDITTTSETMGAYPDAFSEHLVYDLRSGARVRPADVFSTFSPIRSLIQKQLKAIIAAAKADDPSTVEDLDLLLGESPGSVDDDTLGRFTITKNGLIFHYSFGFPHAMRVLEPNEDMLVTWPELRPFLQPEGLLAPLAK
jgi:hypothetical protein